MELSLVELAVAAVLVAIGSLLQGALGFGLAIFAAPLLFLIDPILIPGPVLFLAMVISALILWMNRAGLEMGELYSAVIGRFPGMLLALWLLGVAAPWVLSVVLGAAVLLGVLASLLPWSIRPTRNRLFMAGFLSGFMGTSTGIGGPPMALLYQYARGPYIRANLSAYFLIGTLISLMAMALLGHFRGEELRVALLLTPPALAGLFLARYAWAWVDAGRIRPALLVLCSGSALAVIGDGLRSLIP